MQFVIPSNGIVLVITSNSGCKPFVPTMTMFWETRTSEILVNPSPIPNVTTVASPRRILLNEHAHGRKAPALRSHEIDVWELVGGTIRFPNIVAGFKVGMKLVMRFPQTCHRPSAGVNPGDAGFCPLNPPPNRPTSQSVSQRLVLNADNAAELPAFTAGRLQWSIQMSKHPCPSKAEFGSQRMVIS